MKTFTVAGTSNLNGTVTYRFASTMSRAAVLRSCGHTDVALFALPSAMTKEQAIAYLSTNTLVQAVNDCMDQPADAVVKTAKVKRVSSEYKGDVAAAEFVRMWFTQAEERVAAKSKVIA